MNEKGSIEKKEEEEEEEEEGQTEKSPEVSGQTLISTVASSKDTNYCSYSD